MAPEDEAGNGGIARNRFPPKIEEEEIELSLGLSLNGRFGVDPKMLARSSSAAAVADFRLSHRALKAEEEGFVGPSSAALMRTCSLPAEELRMEGKRKRRRLTLGGEDEVFEQQYVSHAPHAPPSRGSVSSPGSGSSGVSDLDSKPVQGTNKCTEAASPSSTDTENKSPAIIPGTTITEKPGKFSGIIIRNRPNNHEKQAKSPASRLLETMPCVSTRGDGPNGRRVQGFLYRYRKGEELSIVCVCHESFLSPAEFIRHAGGGDVEQPLKHIVVSSSPFL